MTDKKRLEKILPLIREVFGNDRSHNTKFGIKFYEESSHRTYEPENTYFSVNFKNTEITHSTWKGLSIETELENFADFNFGDWVDDLERVLKSRAKVIEIDGEKFRLVPLIGDDKLPWE